MAEQEVPRLNVQTCGRGEYKKFIRDLRSSLSMGQALMSHSHPVLHPMANPIEFRDFILETNNHMIRFRIQRHDVYLVGYQVGEDGPWMEFTHDPPRQLIPGSTPLGFNGGYPALQGRAAVGLPDEQANLPRAGIPLGLDELAAAVDVLAVAGDEDGGTRRARKLLVIIQMISEAIRFDSILDRVATRSPVLPNSTMADLENSWGTLSEYLFMADANPETPFLTEDTRRRLSITCAEDAVGALGVLLFIGFAGSRIPGHGRRLLARGAEDHQMIVGRKLVEVFAVIINNIDKENPGDLYGTIMVNDGLGSQYIFDRPREDTQSVRPKEQALLTGPARCILAYDNFSIHLNLIDRDRDASPDDQVSKGTIWCNTYDLSDSDYDKLRNEDVHGRYGSATVAYAILSSAVSANIEVTLINGDGEDPANVYGVIAASSSKINDAESTLFSRNDGEYVNVSPGSRIPLSRSVVAVPLNSTLRVRALLYDQDTFPRDDEIANNTAEIQISEVTGTSEQSIGGRYGSIKVRVVWEI